MHGGMHGGNTMTSVLTVFRLLIIFTPCSSISTCMGNGEKGGGGAPPTTHSTLAAECFGASYL